MKPSASSTSQLNRLCLRLTTIAKVTTLLAASGVVISLLWATSATAGEKRAEGALPPEAVVVRGNTRHPCINLTPEDVAAARQRVERYDWAKRERDQILQNAAPWLEKSDEYWLKFLPAQGACFAHGFTGCPDCGARTNFTPGANTDPLCSWDEPWRIRCEKGHVLPNEKFPDAGTGYVAPNGTIHYLVGQYNAWVTEQWTYKAIPPLAQAYLLTGDERYAERGLLLLDALASIYQECARGSWDYPSNPTSGRLGRPWYQTARTLVIYADAYDGLYNSAAAGKPSHRAGMTRRENIERCLVLDGARYCYEHSWGKQLTNGHADYLRGALAVGCQLDIPAYIDAAINGPFSINVMLANNLDRDGQYYETSSGYAIHSRKLYLTFAAPLRNLRNREYPQGYDLYADSRLSGTLTLPDLQIQLAGRRPNFGDDAPDVGYLAAPARLFNENDYFYIEQLFAAAPNAAARERYGAILNYLADGKLDALRGGRNRNWMLWHAAEPLSVTAQLPADLEPRLKGSWFAGVKGVATLRQGEQAALLRFGPSLSHGDYDDLSLLYYANGYELSYDLGYGLATTHAQAGWANQTASHPLVTVNEKSQLRGKGGGGGSLLGFAALPSVQFVEADSPRSYSSENVREYRRALALVAGGYFVDCFRVAGGQKHDYGFASIGTALEPFGVKDVQSVPGSLAAGVSWGDKVGSDGDIVGYPNKPSWNPPPGNGYGFFTNVRQAQRAGESWGGVWTVASSNVKNRHAAGQSALPATEHVTKLRVHQVGDAADPVFADAPGIYPHLPRASFVLARRSGQDLTSTFLAVYEPYRDAAEGAQPRLDRVTRLGERALAVYRRDGGMDVLLFGAHQIESPFGRIDFAGDFAYLSGTSQRLAGAETLGCDRLVVGGKTLLNGSGVFTAQIVKVDAAACAVELDAELQLPLAGATAVFSDSAWSRTSGYRLRQIEGRRLMLDAATLSLGVGRVAKREGSKLLFSDIPHEYVRTSGKPTHFFNGKQLIGRSGGIARVSTIAVGVPLAIGVEDNAALRDGELFDYMDLAPGARVRIAVPQVWAAEAAAGR
ncbi:MAG: heparinase II/III family protein [Opitutae bacterium]|nr:heparinase II/III family protein [Opitutae bacterium]